MTITEQDRIQLYRYYQETMGEELAATMMKCLPPSGWGDLATKDDLEQLRLATKRDIDDLRTATTKDIDDLRTATTKDIDVLRTITTKDIAHLHNCMDLKFDAMAATTRNELDKLATKDALHGVREEIASLRVELHDVIRLHTIALVGFMGMIFGLRPVLERVLS